MPHNNEIVLRLQVPGPGQPPVLVQDTEPAGDPSSFNLPPSPLFANLPASALSEVASKVRRRAFSAGSTIYEEGEVADSVFIVASGEVRRFRVDRETSTRENVVTLGVSRPGDAFGTSALVSQTRTESAEAVQRTECVQLAKDDLIGLMISFPIFGLAVSQASIQMATAAEDRVCNFGSGRWSSKRLAGLLLKLAEESGPPAADGGVQVSRQITQGDMASIIQAARETVSIQMKKLREQGAIAMQGRTITVFPDRLREVSGL